VPPNKKKINDFYEHEGKLYIATDYGISVMDVATSEFIITNFIGTSGEETEVLQTTVLNNHIYAVTRSFGIRKGDLANPNLYDFNQWQTFDAGFWGGIVTFNNELVAMNADAKTYRYNGTFFQQVLNQTQAGLKIKTNGTELIITTQNHVFVLNQAYNVLVDITQIPNYNVIFKAATVVNGVVYVGTEKDGLFSAALTNPSVFEVLSPNGPVRNYIFRVKKAPNYLWAVYGDYTRDYNPYALDEFGISKFSNENGWELIPYNDLFQAKSISDIVINPNNPNQVYATSYFSGLLKIEGDNIELFNNTNTGPNGLESLVVSGNPSYIDIRINSPAFDKDGNLWLTNAFVQKAKKEYLLTNDSLGIGKSLVNMAIIQCDKSDFFGSIETSIEALPFLKKKDSLTKIVLASNYNCMAISSSDLKNYDNATKYYLKALEITDNQENKAVYYNNLGDNFLRQKNIEKAIEYFSKALENKDSINFARSINNLAHAKSLKNHNYNPLSDFHKSLIIR
jgi:tetratricopeptide (TPR) repeat protein